MPLISHLYNGKNKSELPHKKCYFNKTLKVTLTHNNSYPEKLCKGGYYYESTIQKGIP
jgi:hypothetical protein